MYSNWGKYTAMNNLKSVENESTASTHTTQEFDMFVFSLTRHEEDPIMKVIEKVSDSSTSSMKHGFITDDKMSEKYNMNYYIQLPKSIGDKVKFSTVDYFDEKFVFAMHIKMPIELKPQYHKYFEDVNDSIYDEYEDDAFLNVIRVEWV